MNIITKKKRSYLKEKRIENSKELIKTEHKLKQIKKVIMVCVNCGGEVDACHGSYFCGGEGDEGGHVNAVPKSVYKKVILKYNK